MNESIGYRDEPWDELIDGEVVYMLPNPGVNHFRVARNIGFLFADYLDGHYPQTFKQIT